MSSITLMGFLETLESELEKSPLTPPSPSKRGEGDGTPGKKSGLSVNEYPQSNRHRPEEPRR